MNKKIYHESGYLNVPYIINRGNTFTFIIGARGVGKSYGMTDYLLNYRDITSQKGKFIYLRRSSPELDAVTADLMNPFKAYTDKHPDIDVRIEPFKKYGRVQLNGSDIGFAAALSTFRNIRGVDFSDFDTIFYDEFIPEASARPIKNEYEAFVNMVETVNRNRELEGLQPVRVILMANSNDLMNPIFIGLNIVNKIYKMQEKKIDIYDDPSRALSVVVPFDSPISEAKRETDLYKLTAGTRFQDMALDNVFQVDSSAIHPMPLIEYKPVARYAEMNVYRHKSRREYYVSCNAIKYKNVYAFSTADADTKRFITKYSYLTFAYLEDHIRFEDAVSLAMFEKLFL